MRHDVIDTGESLAVSVGIVSSAMCQVMIRCVRSGITWRANKVVDGIVMNPVRAPPKFSASPAALLGKTIELLHSRAYTIQL